MIRAAYHGFLLEPPFDPDLRHEVWVPLEPTGQDEPGAIRDLMLELALSAEETGLPRPVKPLEGILAFRTALRMVQIDLADDGSDNLHWFLVRFSP